VTASTDKRIDALPDTIGVKHMPDDRAEIVAQLRRSLALLRGCDAPGTRAQIEQLVTGLRARLLQMAIADSAGNRGRRSAAIPPIPSAKSVGELSALECRSYAIQCESLASMARTPEQQDMLRGLARLWRALATG
jgi:hypothetical protein